MSHFRLLFILIQMVFLCSNAFTMENDTNKTRTIHITADIKSSLMELYKWIVDDEILIDKGKIIQKFIEPIRSNKEDSYDFSYEIKFGKKIKEAIKNIKAIDGKLESENAQSKALILCAIILLENLGHNIDIDYQNYDSRMRDVFHDRHCEEIYDFLAVTLIFLTEKDRDSWQKKYIDLYNSELGKKINVPSEYPKSFTDVNFSEDMLVGLINKLRELAVSNSMLMNFFKSPLTAPANTLSSAPSISADNSKHHCCVIF